MQLFVDSLTNVDFSYLDEKRGLLGETWLANIVLHGELNEQGMVCDFGVVKKVIRDWLDTYVDHCLLVPQLSSCALINQTPETVNVEWIAKPTNVNPAITEKIETYGPQQAITLINADKITPQSVANWCKEQLKPLFPSSVQELKLQFSIEPIESSYYHYSHGLKHHDGNCQRIAHGHRSKILIWRNHRISEIDMDTLAAKWRDIYIGTQSDIIKQTDTSIYFAYSSEQGKFALTLPKKSVYLLKTDTTVEHIAAHILATLKETSPNDYFKVQAFEGINKGAIVEG